MMYLMFLCFDCMIIYDVHTHYELMMKTLQYCQMIIRAVHHGPRTQCRSNRTEYRIDRIEIRKKIQTTEKSRGWLGFRRFLDGIDRLDAIYLFKNFSNERKIIKSSSAESFLYPFSFFFIFRFCFVFFICFLFFFFFYHWQAQSESELTQNRRAEAWADELN